MLVLLKTLLQVLCATLQVIVTVPWVVYQVNENDNKGHKFLIFSLTFLGQGPFVIVSKKKKFKNLSAIYLRLNQFLCITSVLLWNLPVPSVTSKYLTQSSSQYPAGLCLDSDKASHTVDMEVQQWNFRELSSLIILKEATMVAQNNALPTQHLVPFDYDTHKNVQKPLLSIRSVMN